MLAETEDVVDTEDVTDSDNVDDAERVGDTEELALVEGVADTEAVALKEKLPLQAGEVLDATFMNCAMLRDFYDRQIDEAQEQGVLFSLHLKATICPCTSHDPVGKG